MKKTAAALTAVFLCLLLLAGCSLPGSGDTASPTAAPNGATASPAATPAPLSGPGYATVTFADGSASVAGNGVTVDGSKVTISSPGEYTFTGTAENGCIVVNTPGAEDDVKLTLSGVDITNPSGPVILVEQAKEVDLILAAGTENRLLSGIEDLVPNSKQEGAVIFSEDDLDIKGEGSLNLYGWLNNGITCKDDLDIKGGTLTITALNNGIRASESVEISGGEVTVESGGDGIKTTSAKKDGKGFIAVSGGTVTVTAGGDGLAAESDLSISDGTVRVTTTGDPERGSCKALKAKGTLSVSGGTLLLDSQDHGMRSGTGMVLSGGELTIVSHAGKGILAHGALTLEAGTLSVTAETDGIASDTSLTLSGGSVEILAGEDGLKAGNRDYAGGTAVLSGGSFSVHAGDDPIDANGGARITGGTFFGVGTSKTPKSFSSGSTQACVVFEMTAGAGSVRIESAGATAGTFEARCPFTYLVYSSPSLAPGTCRLVRGTLSAEGQAG